MNMHKKINGKIVCQTLFTMMFMGSVSGLSAQQPNNTYQRYNNSTIIAEGHENGADEFSDEDLGDLDALLGDDGGDDSNECPEWKGCMRLRYGYTDVDGDKGRYREDQWRNDESRYGIDKLKLSRRAKTADQYTILFEGRAMYDDYYEASGLIEKKDCHYLKGSFTGYRHYFDGSTKFHDGSSISDNNLYLDRRTYDLEAGITQECWPELILGWNRIERYGEEMPLRSTNPGGVTAPFHTPTPIHQNIYTDTFYGEVGHTLACCYNVRTRTEYEMHDGRVYGRYFTNGFFDEHRDYKNWRQYVLMDACLDGGTYFTLNYMYYDLENDTYRHGFEYGSPLHEHYQEKNMRNSQTKHIVYGRYNKKNFMLCDLTMDLDGRLEFHNTKTGTNEDNQEVGNAFTIHFSRAGTYAMKSHSDQWRALERIKFTYRGCPRTVLTAEAKLEQRGDDDRSWSNDRLTVDNALIGPISPNLPFGGDPRRPPAPSTFDYDRKTDIDLFKQLYTVQAVHRVNSCLKLTARARLSLLNRDYTEKVNTYNGSAPLDYPGYLGDYDRNGGGVMMMVDWKPCTYVNTKSRYEWEEFRMETGLSGRIARTTKHRVASNIDWEASCNLVISATGMYEYYHFDTPVNIDANIADLTWYPGSREYDYRGDNYTVMANGVYTFNCDTTAHAAYRHTEALGGIDFGGRYSYDQADLGLKHKINDCGIVGVGYRYIDHKNQKSGHGSFNNYKAHTGEVTYQFCF